MPVMTKTEACVKLQQVRMELTTLIPRLRPEFAKNADECRKALDEVIEAIVYDQIQKETK